MRISIDLDGILANFGSAVVHSANKVLGKNIPVGYEPRDWDWSEYLTKKDWDVIWADIIHTPGFWANLPAYKDNCADLRQFLFDNMGNYPEIYFITARTRTKDKEPIAVQSKRFLDKNNIFNTGTQMVILPVDKTHKKADLMKALGIKYSIDDHGPTVDLCNNSIEGHKAYVLDRPWNKEYDLPRVFTLGEFLNKVRTAE